MNQIALIDGNGTPTMEAARFSRDEGMARALAHAESDHPKWGEVALEFARRYAQNNEFFPWYFVTMKADLDNSFPAPANEKAWGSVTTMAIKRGIIVDSGKTMPHPRRHGVKATVWKSLVFLSAT